MAWAFQLSNRYVTFQDFLFVICLPGMNTGLSYRGEQLINLT